MNTKPIVKLTDINQNHQGSTLFIKQDELYFPAMRLEIRGKNYFNLEEAKIYNAQKKPYIPNSEQSVYIKPPVGALYETNMEVQKFNRSQGKVNVNDSSTNKIFQPYLSWHGGLGGKNLKTSKGMIRLTGMNHKGDKVRHLFNSSEAIAKDSFAAMYNPIACVSFPRTIGSFPRPLSKTELYKPVTCAMYDDTFFTASSMLEDRNDLVVDYSSIASDGISVLICVHHPSPVYKSRFSDDERSTWVYEPITYTLFDDVPLACSIIFVRTNVEVVLDDAPIMFIGCSLSGQDDVAFPVFKIK